jgi:hypothetical protein
VLVVGVGSTVGVVVLGVVVLGVGAVVPAVGSALG